MTPAQRYSGEDQAILEARHAVYEQARARHPRRWSGHTRNWRHIDHVTLNPERDAVVQATVQGYPLPQDIQQQAA